MTAEDSQEQSTTARSGVDGEIVTTLLERVARLSAEVSELSSRVDESDASNKAAIRSHAAALKKLGARLDGLRIDRQLRALPGKGKRVFRKRATAPKDPDPEPAGLEGTRSTRSAPHLLVLAHAYPVDGRVYGGQPLARRIRFYREAGYEVTIHIPVGTQGSSRHRGEHGEDVQVRRLGEFSQLAAEVAPDVIAVHSPTPELWAQVKPVSEDIPMLTWIHGFEARDWRLLGFDFTESEIAERQHRLDAVTVDRRRAIGELFARRDITTVFVSDYMRTVAEEFAGAPASDGVVIHNVIDPDAFVYRAKSEENRRRIIMPRSFSKRNYGTDLGAAAIAQLAQQSWFSDLDVRIIGEGRHFAEDTHGLGRFDNVHLDERTLPADALGAALASAGIALLPTRWDSQGMMMGESMMAGLVPVTNDVAAIPEFVDHTCGHLAPAEDSDGLAAGIAELFENPSVFTTKSEAAHQRVLDQCGPAATVQREIELFEGARR